MTIQTGKLYRFILCALCAFFVTAHSSFAKRTGFSIYGDEVTMDLPEGTNVTESNAEGTYFLLASDAAPVKALVRIYGAKRYDSALEALNGSLEKIAEGFSCGAIPWNKRDRACGIIEEKVLGTPAAGYAVCVRIPKDDTLFLCVAWTTQKDNVQALSLAASIADSLYPDRSSFFECGPLTSFIFPGEEKLHVELQIDGKTIKTSLDKSDEEAAQYLVDREYSVSLLYQKSPLWKEVWQRYYRMIFRDSAGRLSQTAENVYEKIAPECSDMTSYAQKLLFWTQNLDYGRNLKSSDFTPLPSVLLGRGSDCDSRSMLIDVMLQCAGEDAVMFVSAEYAHAVAGFVSNHPGFSFEAGGKAYLTGETTKKGATWGTIAKEQADSSKWIPVLLP